MAVGGRVVIEGWEGHDVKIRSSITQDLRARTAAAENFAGYHLPRHSARLGVTERIHALSMVSEARLRNYNNSD
jgi:hypothetical protein